MRRLASSLTGRLWCATFAILSLATAAARSSAPSEYEIKALFLYHFAGFVKWPAEAFADDNSALVIGIVGEDPFGPYLIDATKSETAQGRPLAIVHFAHAADVRFCHILFVSPTATDEVDAVLAQVRGHPVLTVGDTENFARRGGIIRFLEINKRLRLRINLTASKEADLIISSKLLRSADVIEPGKGKS